MRINSGPVKNRGYTISHSCVKIAAKELYRRYCDSEKFIVYCKQCHRYNSCWTCPPFDFDTGDYVLSRENAHIIGTKIILDKELISNFQGQDKAAKKAYEIIEEVRNELDETLLDLEKQYPGSRAFFAGTCHICPAGQCARIGGRPCVAPERIRLSLESVGFDINALCAELLNIELKWSRNGILPGYFTLVSGFFTLGADGDIRPGKSGGAAHLQ